MKQKGFAPIIILVLIMLVVVGYLGYKNWSKLKTFIYPIPISTPDPKASWKTFTDPAKDILFKYPEDWNQVQLQGFFVQAPDKSTTLSYYKAPFKDIFDAANVVNNGQNFLTSDKILIFTKIDESSILGGQVVIYSTTPIKKNVAESAIYYYVIKNIKTNTYYVLEFYSANIHQLIDISKEKSIFDQILSTFKFQ